MTIVTIIINFIAHVSFLIVLNTGFAILITLYLNRKLAMIINHEQSQVDDDILFDNIDRTLTIFKVLILLSSIVIFIFSLFSVFNWIEEALPSLLNFFLYFIVLAICSFSHILIYYVTLNKKIKQITTLFDDKDDDIVYAIEKNNIQLETFLNYLLSISIFYSSLHPVFSEGTLIIPILIAQSVFIIKVSENFLIKNFSE